MIKTQWFKVRDKPKHEGWYECRYVREIFHTNTPIAYGPPCFRFWNGKGWMMYDYGSSTAFGSRKEDQWRGLAVKP